MKSQSIVSPEDQTVTFVELFFDLVFVFSVTQVVSLLHHGLDWTVVGQSILVFWLVWWAWSQFTWALNAADTTHYLIEIGGRLLVGVPPGAKDRAGRQLGLAQRGPLRDLDAPSRRRVTSWSASKRSPSCCTLFRGMLTTPTTTPFRTSARQR